MINLCEGDLVFYNGGEYEVLVVHDNLICCDLINEDGIEFGVPLSKIQKIKW